VRRRVAIPLSSVLVAAFIATVAVSWPSQGGPPVLTGGPLRLSYAGDQVVGRVDERFLSFAVDMAQVVGSRFWAAPGRGQGLLETEPVPGFDFSRPRLRRLTAALAPALLRVGGTDADFTQYHLGDGPAPAPTGGARSVLTRARWDEVNRFAQALGLGLVFTLNAGASARDGAGGWDPASARALLVYSAARHYPVELWELGNELNAFPLFHRMWLTPTRYAGDLARARVLLDEVAAGSRLGGPASAFWPVLGEGRAFTDVALERAGALLDVVSWHHYPQQSYRCPVATRRAAAGRMLSPRQLGDVDRWADRVERAAAAHARRAAVWLGETGSAQCGGEPGFSDGFADALWWGDLLGRMARRGQAVLIRQTLAGSSYGLLDEASLTPNPSYWTSWLWRHLMDRRVLDTGDQTAEATLRRYAHCTRAAAPGYRPGAVTALLVNTGPGTSAPVILPPGATGGMRAFVLTAPGLTARVVNLNGRPLRAGEDGTLPDLAGLARTDVGDGAAEAGLRLPPYSLAFVVLPEARAAACASP
jgi:heparanase 1